MKNFISTSIICSLLLVPAQAKALDAVALPLHGEYRLAELLKAYSFDLNDVLPHSRTSLATFFAAQGIAPATQPLTIDPEDSVDQRLQRWGIGRDQPIMVDSSQKFKTLVLATLESYFRLQSNGVPTDSRSPLDVEDQFSGALLREIWGHDIYTNSSTLPGSAALIDGSVLFETAYAPVETGNWDLLRDKTLVLSQLEMIRLDQQDGVVNGAEQKILAAELFDRVAGTHYTAAVKSCSPALTARVDIVALQGPTDIPFAFKNVNDLANRNHLSVETFIRSMVVFHALAVGGISAASANPPAILDQWTVWEAQAALSSTPPQPFQFGFIDFSFDPAVKAKMRTDLNALTTTGQNVFLRGDSNFPGTVGKNSFLEKILFSNYGVNCPQAELIP